MDRRPPPNHIPTHTLEMDLGALGEKVTFVTLWGETQKKRRKDEGPSPTSAESAPGTPPVVPV